MCKIVYKSVQRVHKECALRRVQWVCNECAKECSKNVQTICIECTIRLQRVNKSIQKSVQRMCNRSCTAWWVHIVFKECAKSVERSAQMQKVWKECALNVQRVRKYKNKNTTIYDKRTETNIWQILQATSSTTSIRINELLHPALIPLSNPSIRLSRLKLKLELCLPANLIIPYNHIQVKD